MINYITPILASTIIFFVCGCEKEEKPYVPVQLCPEITNNMDTILKYIPGTWSWVEEKRFNRITREYEYFTPKDFGTWFLNFSGDTAKFFKNETIDSVYRFKIQRLFEIPGYLPTDSLPVLAYYSFHTGMRRSYVPIMICDTQLLMQLDIFSDIAGNRIWIRK
jgi:hypothetical protein